MKNHNFFLSYNYRIVNFNDFSKNILRKILRL